MSFFRIYILSCVTFLVSDILAQKIPNASVLQLEEIMKGNEFIGHQPENVRWSIDGSKIYFDWNPKNEPGNSIYEYQPALKGSKPVLADPKSILEFDPSQSAFSDQYQIIDGSLTRFDKKTKQLLRNPYCLTNASNSK